MAIELIKLKLKARATLAEWYRRNLNNKAGIDHLLDNELRFIMDNPTRSRSRQWLFKRFPKLMGSV